MLIYEFARFYDEVMTMINEKEIKKSDKDKLSVYLKRDLLKVSRRP